MHSDHPAQKDPEHLPSVEICIVAYGNSDTIANCVTSATRAFGDISVALHDNKPSSPTVDMARRAAQASGIKFRAEFCEENCGFGSGCNSLARTSNADFLLFLNPDAEILSWSPDLGQSIGVRGAVIVDQRGARTFRNGANRRTLWDEFSLRLLRVRPSEPDGVGYVCGAAMLVDRKSFINIGMFDSNFFMYYEDIDLCMRAVSSGLSVATDDQFRVRHLGGYSAQGNKAAAFIRSYESSIYFHRKTGHSVRGAKLLFAVDALLRLLWSVVFRGPRSSSSLAYTRLLHHILLGNFCAKNWLRGR